MNRINNKYILALLLLMSTCLVFGYQQVYAQGGKRAIVRGKVIDANTKLPLSGATVIEIDGDDRTINGTSTDIDGNFALRVNDPEHNRISGAYINYKPTVLRIKDSANILIALQDEESALNDVQVTAYNDQVDNGTGMKIRERDNTLSTASIQQKEIENLSSPNIAAALEGRLPGVNVSVPTGDPGAGLSIQIRGTATINGSGNPLIVVDGMPYSTTIPSDFNFGTADAEGYAQLLNIAPSDIQDITVLKDAAATALWGSQAANGVLVINTKRGKTGKPSISYTFRGTYSKQPKSVPLLDGNQYSTLIPEEVANAGGNPLDISANKEFSFDPLDPYWYYNYSNNTNWIDAITQTGYSQDHSISMTGGGQKAKYYASVGYFHQDGTTIGTGLDRITAKVNLDYNVSNRIRIRSNFTFAHLNRDLNFLPSNKSAYQIRNIAYNKMPNMSIYEYDIYGNQSPNYFTPESNIQGQYPSTYNPVALAENAKYVQNGDRITPSFQLQYQMVPKVLLATFDVQFDINNSGAHTFLPQNATGRPLSESIVNEAKASDGDAYSVTTKTNFIYTPKSNDRNHQFQALLSLQTNDSKSNAYNVLTTNTASSEFDYPFNGSRATNSAALLTSTLADVRSIGTLLQAQYGWLDRYILNAGVRMDGNSRFGPNNRYGFFPSLSARWRLSGENFMKKYSGFIDDLSFRASYGHAGSAPPDKTVWQYFNTYSPYSYSYLGESGVYSSNVELTNLKWQTLVGTNLGFNLWMFKNRFRIDFEVYRNRIQDMFYDDLDIPSYTGFSSMPANVGTMDNQGWEALLNTIPYQTKNWKIGFDLNFASNQNIIRSISDFYPRTNVESLDANGKYKTFLQVNNPFGSFYGFKYLGVYSTKDQTVARDAAGNQITDPNGNLLYMRFQYPSIDYVFQPGDAKYADINHDGNIDDKDVVYLGNGLPKITGGFGLNVTFKDRLKLITFFDYKLDYDIVNAADMATTNMYSFDNQSTAVLGRWRNPGDVTNIPRALYKKGYNWLGSSRYVQDASYVRLQAVTLRYTFQPKLLNKLNIRSASCYVTVENLYTWTKYKGQNPDVSIIGNNSPFAYPVDNALTPPSRNVLLGINLSF
ncbi:TonB-linked outer membrane protein, SusC/RagA family [Arachidicoccus rhizosphaerae]|uniref:TonB-linked outer membrane protein, SusC/RagA family n=1 Tax=Arachidicoccus rhizosphaerae TaxID=551991 RepID=A0A1H3VQQ8_9BACT|nr:SusC/RagA family TonB-linked outer membrane protein [Arachidicoccus rhizosphaerae]SDZ76574.1 TonB-linked outer membrane protein, SusC/RagA family [Arachidicoccus rhizosphaerae]